MILRLGCLLSLAILAGCGGPKAPQLGSESQEPSRERSSASRSATTSSVRPTPEATVESLTISMQQAVQNENYSEALKFAERLLEKTPEDGSTLYQASELAQRLGKQETEKAIADRARINELFIKSAAYMRRINKPRNKLVESQLEYLSQVFYHEAGALANLGEDAKATAALMESLECGFSKYQLIKSNPELARLLLASSELAELFNERRQEHLRRRRADAQRVFAAQEPYTFDFELVSTDGELVRLADFQGKVLMVDFWGTWCGPCIKEIPHFLELLRNYQDDGLEIVGINYERGDPASFKDTIKAFAKEYGVTYPCLLGDDLTKRGVRDFEAYPTTLFIDRAGIVRLQVVGYHPYDHLETIVESLLAEEP